MPHATKIRTAAGALLGAFLVSAIVVGGAGAEGTGSDPTIEIERAFEFAGLGQVITVPEGVRAIDAIAIGGHGEARNGVAGGRAARVEGRLVLDGLEEIVVYVGSNGSNAAGGFNGGGDASGSGEARGGAGGGASDIRTDLFDPATRLLVAAGGGGAGGHANGGGTAKAGAAGGDAGAGGARAESAGPENTYGSGGFGGAKGTASAGGAGGEGGFPYGGSGYDGFDGGAGGLASGGAGGLGPVNSPPGYGGGGGGGLYGGGGGGGGALMMGGTPIATGGGGGGGGSSLVPDGGTLELAAADTEPSITISYSIPGTEITGPTGVVRQDQLSFEISSEEEDTTFECRFDSDDDEAWEGCGPAFETPVLAEGPHLLEARATNAMGNFDPTPARAAFVVDLRPPPPAQPAGNGAPVAIAPSLSLGRPKLNRRKGSALIPVSVATAGTVVLHGGGKLRGASRSVAPGGRVWLPVRAKRGAARALARRGSLRVVVRVALTAADGQVAVATRKLTLRRARR